ncbi:MAG: LysM peptidoglycan-binding domain-containing protein [Bacteroidota bacterium]
MKNLIWIILMGTSFASLAQRYILFNPVCMERQKYDVINGYGGESYITYSIELKNGEKVFLEVGKESEKYESRITRAVITCNSPSINQAMVGKINAGIEQIFIVLKEGQGRFKVSKVASAAYFKNSDRGIQYTGKGIAFAYNELVNTPSQNLANPSVGGRVFFVGASQYECMDTYTFSISTQQNSNVGSDLTILPSIGVIEYRTNASGGVGTRRLSNVNAKKFRSIVQDICKTGGETFENDLTDRGGVEERPIVTRPPETTTRPAERPATTPRPAVRSNTNTNVRPSNTPADYGIIARHTGSSTTDFRSDVESQNSQPTQPVASANDDMHIVAKGETLFRIAKKYGVTVNQIKDWNNLNSNTIFVGNKLYVSAPNAVRDEGTFVDRGGNSSTPVTTAPDRNRNTNIAITDFDSQAEYHILKRGETLAGVARLYGFTEEKFRQMNNIFPNETLPIGYRLRTSDCNCPAKDDYQRDDYRNDNSRKDDYYRDEFVDRGSDMDDGFDDIDFRRSVNTPAPYENDRYERIDAKRTQIPMQNNRTMASDDRFSDRLEERRPDSFEDSNFRRLDARGTTADDRSRNTTFSSSSNSGSALNIRFDREQQLHLVKENETLYSIARKYRTTVSRLAEANNLDPREVLLPGQSIFIK